MRPDYYISDSVQFTILILLIPHTAYLRLGCYQKMNIHCFQLSMLCVGIVVKAVVVNQLQEEMDF